MGDQLTVAVLRKQVPQLYKMWLNGVAKSFVEQYQKIGQEKIDFPTQEMEKNLQEISAVLDQEEDILESTVSVSEIANRIFQLQKAISFPSPD